MMASARCFFTCGPYYGPRRFTRATTTPAPPSLRNPCALFVLLPHPSSRTLPPLRSPRPRSAPSSPTSLRKDGNRAPVLRRAQEIDLGPRPPRNSTAPTWTDSSPASLPSSELTNPPRGGSARLGQLKVWTLPAMVMFKIVAAGQLTLLWCISLMANAFRMLPANPASNCGPEVYQRVILTLDFHVLTALTAAVLLLAVRMAVSAAEFNAITALRMAVVAAESKVVAATHVHSRVKAFDALHGVTAARMEGVSSITVKWCRASLRGMLLLAVVLSAASCLLAAVALEEGCMYWTGCDSGYGVGWALSVFLMVLMALMHGTCAWVAVSQN